MMVRSEDARPNQVALHCDCWQRQFYYGHDAGDERVRLGTVSRLGNHAAAIVLSALNEGPPLPKGKSVIELEKGGIRHGLGDHWDNEHIPRLFSAGEVDCSVAHKIGGRIQRVPHREGTVWAWMPDPGRRQGHDWMTAVAAKKVSAVVYDAETFWNDPDAPDQRSPTHWAWFEGWGPVETSRAPGNRPQRVEKEGEPSHLVVALLGTSGEGDTLTTPFRTVVNACRAPEDWMSDALQDIFRASFRNVELNEGSYPYGFFAMEVRALLESWDVLTAEERRTIEVRLHYWSTRYLVAHY